MKKILFSVLALGAMTGAALAEPQKMNEAQLEGIAGGVSVDQSNWSYQNAFSLALGGLGAPVTATAGNASTQSNANETRVESTFVPGIPSGNGNGNGSGNGAIVPPVSIDLPNIDLGGLGGSQ